MGRVWALGNIPGCFHGHFGGLHWKLSGPKALTFAGSVITPHHPFLKAEGADVPPAPFPAGCGWGAGTGRSEDRESWVLVSAPPPSCSRTYSSFCSQVSSSGKHKAWSKTSAHTTFCTRAAPPQDAFPAPRRGSHPGWGSKPPVLS